MKKAVSRRDFLQAGVLGSAGAVLVWPALARNSFAASPAEGVCVTLCNHWSYIGIGWQLGIESCVLSATDAMEMADRPPHAKTCLNLDARAYEFMAEKFPEVAERLRQATGRREGGTDRRHVRPADGHDHQRRVQYPADRRRAGDDPQGPRLRDGHVP